MTDLLVFIFKIITALICFGAFIMPFYLIISFIIAFRKDYLASKKDKRTSKPNT